MARPTTFAQETADQICQRLAEGESLRGICKDDEMPAMSTVFRWLTLDKQFSEQYARAREEQAETLADEIVEIADEEVTMIKRSKHGGDDSDDAELEVVFDATAVARNRLRVDARKWVASKLKPKKYGEKVTNEHTGADGGPMVVEKIERVIVRPADRDS